MERNISKSMKLVIGEVERIIVEITVENMPARSYSAAMEAAKSEAELLLRSFFEET